MVENPFNLPLSNLCSYLTTKTNVERSSIEELTVRKEEDGVQHEFLIILFYKRSGEELWVRLERKKPLGILRKLIPSISEARDMVSAAIDHKFNCN